MVTILQINRRVDGRYVGTPVDTNGVPTGQADARAVNVAELRLKTDAVGEFVLAWRVSGNNYIFDHVPVKTPCLT